jgi:bidirectional [NiFe] hydrogenase diaphorase subunit
VEVQGSPKLQAACVTSIHEGMVVNTESEKLNSYRQSITEMLFTEGNHICAVCVSNGNCELQSMAQHLKIDHISLPYTYPARAVDASHEDFVFDPNRCILCTRCVRTCDEVEGAHTWDVSGRGIQSRLITDLDGKWGDSTSCTSCGKCVQVCPTGALYEKGAGEGEMKKSPSFLAYLQDMRSSNHD